MKRHSNITLTGTIVSVSEPKHTINSNICLLSDTGTEYQLVNDSIAEELRQYIWMNIIVRGSFVKINNTKLLKVANFWLKENDTETADRPEFDYLPDIKKYQIRTDPNGIYAA